MKEKKEKKPASFTSTAEYSYTNFDFDSYFSLLENTNVTLPS